jgi:hypothetical protein
MQASECHQEKLEALTAALEDLGQLVRDSTAEAYQEMNCEAMAEYLAAPDKAALLREVSKAFRASTTITYAELKAGKRVDV